MKNALVMLKILLILLILLSNISYASIGETHWVCGSLSDFFNKEYIKNAKSNDFVSRDESCAIVCRLTNSKISSELSPFDSVFEISNWAIPYVSAMKKSEIVIGYPYNIFKSKNLESNAEYIDMLSRLEGASGADNEDLELIFDESNDLEIGMVNLSGDSLYVIPIENELFLEVGDRLILSIARPPNTQDDLIVENYNLSTIEFDKETNLLTAISPGNNTVSFKTKDGTYVKRINIYIH